MVSTNRILLKSCIYLSGDIETNPGPAICQQCQKTVCKNSMRLECKICKEFLHLKCLKNANSTINLQKQSTLYTWICPVRLFSILPFHNVRDIANNAQPEQQISRDQHDKHLEILLENRNLLNIAHLNTQPMISTFGQFMVFMEKYNFDIITLSET